MKRASVLAWLAAYLLPSAVAFAFYLYFRVAV